MGDRSEIGGTVAAKVKVVTDKVKVVTDDFYGPRDYEYPSYSIV